MDLAAFEDQKVPTVNSFPSIRGELKKLTVVQLVVAFIVFGSALGLRGLHDATHVLIGILLTSMNIYFYALLGVMIFVKKNIAWIGPVIVIKYLILMASIYMIWQHGDLMLVTVGLFAELFLSSLFMALLKFFESRRALKNGTL